MKLRTIIFWTHLVTAVTAVVVVFIMSVTGVLLTYQRQMLDWFDTRHYRAAPASPDTPRLQPHELIGAVRDAEPNAAVTSITIRADPTAPAAIGIGRRTLFVDPYTGHVWGGGAEGPRAFFRTIGNWHRYLGVPDDWRGIGRAVTGACNAALVFIILSGFYLWWPRTWSWRALRNAIWFRRRLPGKARDFNWHNVVGIASAGSLVMVWTGLALAWRRFLGRSGGSARNLTAPS